MRSDRWAELRELVKATQASVDRADQEMTLQVEFLETWIVPTDDHEDPEARWQALRAQIQLPDAAD
jgi:hypothetical protein